MCGIAGILNLQGALSPGQLRTYVERMASTMVHRGPDDSGVWVQEQGLCALAQRRLSIIDLSPGGHQPMLSHDGEAAITFNGEIYNYQDIRRELLAAGITFRSSSDTEVLLEAVRHFGAHTYERLDGMYAFALWNSRTRTMTVARDPFGEKPLYISRQGNYVAFASELHALAVLPEFDCTIDDAALGEYFALQYIHAPRTIFRAAQKLLPGTAMVIDAEGREAVTQHFSFDPLPEVTPHAPMDELADELEALLTTSVRRRMISDVPLGAFLSGGVDSSTTVALMKKVRGESPGAIKTFSIGFTSSAESEHLAAREVAHYLGSEHHDEVLSPEVLPLLDHLGQVLDEPNADSSCLPTFLLSKFARTHVTVALSGDGGDELFGGYGRYFTTLAEQGARFPFLTRSSLGPWSAGSAYLSSRLLLFTDSDLAALLGDVPLATAQLLAEWRAEISDGPGTLLSRMRRLDARTYMPGAVLPKVDRMSMQHSLEVRTPFLNRQVAAFASRLPDSSLYRRDFKGAGHGKLVLKEVAARFLPRQWLDRPKQGFGLPTQRWGEKAFLTTLRARLTANQTPLATIIDPRLLQRFLARQERSFSLYQTWSVLILDQWIRNHKVVRSDSLARDSSCANSHGSLSIKAFTSRNDTSAQPLGARAFADESSYAPELPEGYRLIPAFDLVLYLTTLPARSVVVFFHASALGESLPRTLATLPALRACYVTGASRTSHEQPTDSDDPTRGSHEDRWLSDQFWLESGSASSTLFSPGDTVVVDVPLELLPAAALERLHRDRVQWLISYESGAWSVKRLSGVRAAIQRTAAAWLTRIQGILPKGSSIPLFGLCARVRLALARRILNRWAIDLPRSAAGGFKWDDGFSYEAPLPALCGFSDTAGDFRSNLLLFENETLLTAHAPHNVLRRIGFGRFSHWYDTVFFSSTDNSDPNDNGRKYRYLFKNRAVGWARKLCLRPEMLFHSCAAPANRQALEQIVLATPSPLLRSFDCSSSLATLGGSLRRAITRGKALPPLSQHSFEEHFERLLGHDGLSTSNSYPAEAGSSSVFAPGVRAHSCDVALYIGALSAGGAERQLCYLARYLKEQGVAVTVLVPVSEAPDHLHYLPMLTSADVPVRFVSSPAPSFDLSHLLLTPSGRALLEACVKLPGYFNVDVWNLFTHLATLRPKVLHCWLDFPNLVGGVAGILADVPRIVLSTRNLNPTHFPYLFNPWLHPWYRTLSNSSRTRFIANSRAGALSYASWLGVPPERFVTILNGLHFSALPEPTALEVGRLRHELSLDPESPVLLGVFRLSPEKRPLDFLEVARRLRHQIPDLRILIAGVGSMRPEVELEIVRLGLQDAVTMLGRRDPVFPLYKIASLLLLTSAQEGTPNVLMEAQFFGCPVVTTEAGGAPDVVADGSSGFVTPCGDLDTLTEHCRALLLNPELRSRCGAAGKEWIKKNFTVERMAAQTMRLYEPSVFPGSAPSSAAQSAEYRDAAQ